MPENKKVNLADLGLDESTVESKNQETKKEEQKKNEPIATNIEYSQQKEYKVKEGSYIVRPDANIDSSKPTEWQELNINDFAKNPITKKEDPAKKTMDNLYQLADTKIKEQEVELSKPGGRIDEAKRKYIDYNYEVLMRNSKNSKSAQERIKFVENILDTDARFEGITPYERKAYILYKVAKDLNAGVTDEDFGITAQDMPRLPMKNSRDNQIENDRITKDRTNPDNDDYLLKDNKFVIMENKDNNIPFKKVENNVQTPTPPTDININDNELLSTEEETTNNIVETSGDAANFDFEIDETESLPSIKEISEEQKKANRKEYATEVTKALNLSDDQSLNGYTFSDEIDLNTALAYSNKINRVNNTVTTWGMEKLGKSFSFSSFTGEDIVQLSPETVDYDTLNGLKTVFTVLYKHLVGSNKPSFEAWLRSIPEADMDSVLFGVYVSCFKDNNYITYECPNKSCGKIYIEKYDINKMVKYKDEKIKERFENILKGEMVETKFFRELPFKISKTFAVGFMPRTVYSGFEYAALNEKFVKDNMSVVSLLPVIDKFYLIDENSKEMKPIKFTINPKEGLEKIVLKKISIIKSIIRSLTVDERTVLFRKAIEYLESQSNVSDVTYQKPESVCPSCGTKIEAQVSHPINLLFTRAQLPIAQVYLQE